MSDTPDGNATRALANEDLLDIGSAAPRAAAILDGVMAEALGLALYNIVEAQQRASIERQAAVSMAASGMMALCFAADGEEGGEGGPAAAPPASAAAAPALAAEDAGEGGGGGGTREGGGDGGASRLAAQAGSDVDPVIVDAINQVRIATLTADASLASADGKAARLVAASAALAIADAADGLRGATTLAIVNSAMALTRYAMTGDERYAAAATAGHVMVMEATQAYEAASAAATNALKAFPVR